MRVIPTLTRFCAATFAAFTLCLTGVARAQQSASPTPAPPLASTSTDAITDSQSLASLMRKIDEVVTRGGGKSLSQGSYHFVVLMDTSRTQGGGAQIMRDMYHDLLYSYLVPAKADEAADMISFFPFQMRVRGADARSNQRFTAETAATLYKAVPTAPAAETDQSGTTYVGGHDQGAALLTALREIQSPRSAVVILLSDGGDTSVAPDNVPNYSLTDNAPEYADALAKTQFAESLRGKIMRPAYDGAGKQKQNLATVWYRVYLPTVSATQEGGIAPLAELGANRDALAGVPEPTGTVAATPQATATPDLDAELDNDEEIDPAVPAGILGVLLLLGVGVAAFMGLRPQRVMVAGSTVDVKPGKRFFIVPTGGGAYNVTPDENQSAGAVAWLEKSAFRAPQINTNHEISGEDKPLSLDNSEKTVAIVTPNGNTTDPFRAVLADTSG